MPTNGIEIRVGHERPRAAFDCKDRHGAFDADEHCAGELLPSERIGPPLAGTGGKAMFRGRRRPDRARRWLGTAGRSGDLAESGCSPRSRPCRPRWIAGYLDRTGQLRRGRPHFPTRRSQVDDKTSGPRRTAPDHASTGFEQKCRRSGRGGKVGDAATDDNRSPICSHRRRRAGGPALAASNCRSADPTDACRGRGPSP